MPPDPKASRPASELGFPQPSLIPLKSQWPKSQHRAQQRSGPQGVRRSAMGSSWAPLPARFPVTVLAEATTVCSFCTLAARFHLGLHCHHELHSGRYPALRFLHLAVCSVRSELFFSPENLVKWAGSSSSSRVEHPLPPTHLSCSQGLGAPCSLRSLFLQMLPPEFLNSVLSPQNHHTTGSYSKYQWNTRGSSLVFNLFIVNKRSWGISA